MPRSIDFQLGAAQWAVWQRTTAIFARLLLRNAAARLLRRRLTISALEKDEIDRDAVPTRHGRAPARYRGDSNFSFRSRNDELIPHSSTTESVTHSMTETTVDRRRSDRRHSASCYRAKFTLQGSGQRAPVTGNDIDQLVYTLDVSPSKPNTCSARVCFSSPRLLCRTCFPFAGLEQASMVSPPQPPPSSECLTCRNSPQNKNRTNPQGALVPILPKRE